MTQDQAKNVVLPFGGMVTNSKCALLDLIMWQVGVSIPGCHLSVSAYVIIINVSFLDFLFFKYWTFFYEDYYDGHR